MPNMIEANMDILLTKAGRIKNPSAPKRIRFDDLPKKGRETEMNAKAEKTHEKMIILIFLDSPISKKEIERIPEQLE